MENKDKLFDELRRPDDCQGTDIALLDESNIVGVSLNGKSSSELSVTQLTRDNCFHTAN